MIEPSRMAKTDPGSAFKVPGWLKAIIPIAAMILLYLVLFGPPSCSILEVESRDSLTNRAIEKQKRGDLDGAISDLDEAIKHDPEFTIAYYNRGTLKLLKEDYSGAVADFEKAIEFKTRMPDVYHNLGLARFRSGDFEGAIEALDGAVGLNAENFDAYRLRGIVYMEKGELDLAIKDFEGAIFIDPGKAIAHYMLACALGKKGDKKAMYEKLQHVIGMNSANRKIIAEDEAFATYRHDIEFKKLIEDSQ